MTRTDPTHGHRERLLAAAVACLQEKGYARTTARDLVAASGTNLASIGYHFGGKEALLNEALTECFRIWNTRIEKAVFASADASPRDRLEQALIAMIGAFGELRPVIRSWAEAFPAALHSAELRDRFAAAYAETRATAADMITRACEDAGQELPAPPEIMASVLMALCDGLMLQWLLDPQATPDAQQVVAVLTGMAPILTPPPAT